MKQSLLKELNCGNSCFIPQMKCSISHFLLESGSIIGSSLFGFIVLFLLALMNPTNLSAQDYQRWTGSGIAISNRLVATNYHVVNEAKTLAISIPSDSKYIDYSVEVVATDKANDLAILRITDSKFKGFNTIPYGNKTQLIDVGENIFVLGYPLVQTMGDDVKLTTGVISSISGFQGDASTYQISAAVQPGNSGGPLFDTKGDLVGIVSAKHTGAENAGYAIKLSNLQALVSTLPSRVVLPSKNTIASKSLSEKVKAIQKYVVLIKANFTDNQRSTVSIQGNAYGSYNADKSKAEELYESALYKFKQGYVEQAYKDICESVSLYPTTNSCGIRAYIGMYLADYDAVIESCEFNLTHGDTHPFVRNMYASALSRKERYQDAIKQYSILIEADRHNIEALYNRALCYDMIGQDNQALADYQEAVKYEGLVEFDEYSTVYNNIAYWCIVHNQIQKAIEPIKKALSLDHTTGYIWDTDGELQFKLGNYAECVSSMNNAIVIGKLEKASYLHNSYYYRGLANKKLGNLTDAYKDLEKAIELGSSEANEELAKMNASSIDFSKSKSFNEVVKAPIMKTAKSTDIKIVGIEKTNEYTALYCTYTNTKYSVGGWYSISPDAYIRDKASGKRYKFITAENCAMSPEQTSIELKETKKFVLYFQAIPQNAKEIDFVESDDSSWQFFGIKLK